MIERLVRQAAKDPLSSRRGLFSSLLGSPTHLLYVGEKKLEGVEVKAFKAGDKFPLWCELDQLLGGIWVPLFTRHQNVGEFASRRGLQAPSGGHFQWMRHEAGKVYGMLQSIPCFAGIWLDPYTGGGVRLEWPEVNALSEGRVPSDAPVLYPLPVDRYQVPEGTKCVLGSMNGYRGRVDGQQALFPEAGQPALSDFRRLVRLEIDGDGPVWTPCRHFISMACMFREKTCEPRHIDVLMRSLVEFEMYGDAEAICRRMMDKPERRPFAMTSLAVVFRRSGSLETCIEVCRDGIAEYPGERLFYVNRCLAHAQLEDLEAARETARLGVERFPDDPNLRKFL